MTTKRLFAAAAALSAITLIGTGAPAATDIMDGAFEWSQSETGDRTISVLAPFETPNTMTKFVYSNDRRDSGFLWDEGTGQYAKQITVPYQAPKLRMVTMRSNTEKPGYRWENEENQWVKDVLVSYAEPKNKVKRINVE